MYLKCLVPLKTKRFPTHKMELASTSFHKCIPVIFLHVSGHGSSLWNCLLTCVLGSWDVGVVTLVFSLHPGQGDFGWLPRSPPLLQPLFGGETCSSICATFLFEWNFTICLQHCSQPHYSTWFAATNHKCLFSNVTTTCHFHLASRKNSFRLIWIFK